MPPPWIIEAIDILEYRAFCLTACVPTIAPDQLYLDGFKERLNHRIVVTIALAAHPLPRQCMFTCMRGGDLEAML